MLNGGDVMTIDFEAAFLFVCLSLEIIVALMLSDEYD
jgi:hypothetical protein